MHEAGEATCGDVPGPLKALCPDFKMVEKLCEAAAFAQFGITMFEPALMKEFDMRMLATERRDLMPYDTTVWENLVGVEPLPDTIVPLSAEDSARAFLDHYAELTG